ncbi:hypothetical protein AB0L55_09425 [Streptomyces anthocyanicus]|uniref:hypothetical protein n=1 Tax=Streptomyces anthocyanicus TaxID=68174 RepID=UPI003444B307
MDSELTVLAASSATTLVSLMVTDSWAHARGLVGRYLTRAGADPDTSDDLRDTRTRLLAADSTERERTAREISRRYGDRLRRLADADDGSGEALRALLTSLLQLSASAAHSGRTVDNRISGGVQHGPVVQSDTVTADLLRGSRRSHGSPPVQAQRGHRTFLDSVSLFLASSDHTSAVAKRVGRPEAAA